jgi:ribonuclease HI
MKKLQPQKTTIRIYTDGSGQRPDGKGSGIAWYRVDKSQRHTEAIPGLTNNEAEYRAVISAVEALERNSEAEILTDSELVCCQFSGQWRVSNPMLSNLLCKLRTLAARKQVCIKLTWIPRRENLAGKMI